MLSIPDMALLGAAALMFFGPEQLPKVARKVGLLVRDVQNTSQSFIREMERAGDDHAYNPDISRAHLIEEAAGTTPAAPVTYEPPAYEPPVYEPANDHPYAAVDYADHTEAHAEPAALPDRAAAPGATPVLHDIVAPRANGAAGDHDLPP
jgi:sec-independent protein translocase protein TatA